MDATQITKKGTKMAGWSHYNEQSGEVESGLYEFPYMVRATPRNRTGDVTIAAFITQEKADEFIKKYDADYKQGSYNSAFANLHVENWNL